MSLTVKIRGDASQFEKTMRGVKSSIGGLSAAIGGAGAATAVAGLAAGFVAVGKAAQFLQSSSEKAAGIESLTMQFETLLGSATAAKKRMAEIAKFAAATPFEIAELSATSKLLQVMGGTLLATGEGLRMVGDAAAITGQPLQEVGLHIGRLFNAITSGTSAGESVNRLQELGLITGTIKREFEALAEAQKKGKKPILDQAQALAMLKGVLSATDGAMARLSTTTEGLKSNLKDNVDTLMVKFGTGFNEGLKDALTAANGFIPQLEKVFESAGLVVGDAISRAVQGDTERLANIGAMIGTAIFEGMKAVYLRGFDELIASVQNQFLEDDLTKFTRFLAEKTGTDSGLKPPPQKVQPANLAGYMQTAIENVSSSSAAQGLQKANLEIAIREGMKTGIDMSMPQAVREGVLEAMKRQPQEAKFSN